MKKIIKRVILFSGLAIGLLFLLGAWKSTHACKGYYKEGDIVFQISKSEQSPLIQYATGSPWSHCGIIVFRNDRPRIRYRKYLGQPYDLAFKFNNGRMYCSELVYEIYKNQLGIELCKPRKISSYRMLGLGKVMKRRHMDSWQLVVAPSDLLE